MQGIRKEIKAVFKVNAYFCVHIKTEDLNISRELIILAHCIHIHNRIIVVPKIISMN